jgi:hypothetical protein
MMLKSRRSLCRQTTDRRQTTKVQFTFQIIFCCTGNHATWKWVLTSIVCARSVHERDREGETQQRILWRAQTDDDVLFTVLSWLAHNVCASSMNLSSISIHVRLARARVHTTQHACCMRDLVIAGCWPKLSNNPFLRACSSSAALTATGLHNHVQTHWTSTYPAYLYVTLFVNWEREEECCYFQNPRLKKKLGLTPTRNPS